MRPWNRIGLLTQRVGPCLLALAVLGAAFAPSGTASDPIERLRRWTAHYDGPASLRERGGSAADLDAILDELASLDLRAPEKREEIAIALLDLGAVRPSRPRSAKIDEVYQPDAATAALRARAHKQLDVLFASDAQGELARALALHVLAAAKPATLDRRLALIEVLRGKYLAATELGLLFAHEHGELSVRRAALEALSGWPDEAVHKVMANELELSLAENADFERASAALSHFERVVLPASSAAREVVQRYVAHALIDLNWRAATRGLRVAPSLSNDDVVPELIEALATWTARRGTPTNSLRIELEIVRELERRAKSRIGPHPERWRAWWQALKNGTLLASEEGEPSSTSASFFGLRPLSNRVTFVVDRSGSMRDNFGALSRSRWDEAVRELDTFVSQLAPDGRFRVVLFSDAPLSLKLDLQVADAANLAQLRAWLAGQRPGGSTALQAAIYDALNLDANGSPTAAKLDADTLIVLCDGGTDEGPQWVEPLFKRLEPQLCVRIDSVLIGSGGDGTLEALSKATGGEFERIDH